MVQTEYGDILESIKKLADGSKEPMIVITETGDILFSNTEASLSLRKKGSSLISPRIRSFFSGVWYLAHNNSFYRVESVADFCVGTSNVHLCRLR